MIYIIYNITIKHQCTCDHFKPKTTQAGITIAWQLFLLATCSCIGRFRCPCNKLSRMCLQCRWNGQCFCPCYLQRWLKHCLKDSCLLLGLAIRQSLQLSNSSKRIAYSGSPLLSTHTIKHANIKQNTVFAQLSPEALQRVPVQKCVISLCRAILSCAISGTNVSESMP